MSDMDLETDWEVSGSPYAIRSTEKPFSIVVYLQQLTPMPSETLAKRIVDDHNEMIRVREGWCDNCLIGGFAPSDVACTRCNPIGRPMTSTELKKALGHKS